MADVKLTLVTTGSTFSRNIKTPLEADRIFNTLALAQAHVDDVDSNAYVGLTISVVNDGDNNGLYYVNQIADADHATGVLTKIGSDSAQDVADLKAAVEALETAVGDENSGITADVAANAAAIEKKADSFEVGNGLSFAEGKIDLVVDPAEGNSLEVTENGLYVTVPEVEVPEYTLDSVTNPADAYAAQYEFKKDGIVLNTINIPKDQFLKSASFHDVAEEGVTAVAPYLKFVWQLDIDAETEGEQTITYIPVADLVDTYTQGDYILISENAISVDYESLKANINTDLVAPAVVRVETLETKVSGLETTTGEHTTKIGVLETAKSDHETRIATLEGVQHPTLEQVTTLENNYNTLNTNITNLQTSVTEIKVKDVDATVSNGVNLSLDAAGKIGINVDIDTIADAVIEKHVVSVDAADIALSENIGTEANPDRYTTEDSVQGVLASMNARIESIDSDIQSALEGGVTGIEAGNGISVDNTVATKPAVSVKIASGSALRSSADGLDLVWEELA